MNQPDPKTNLLEHSKAKVALYGLYLEKYLNILSRTSSVERIFIFDLFCGEGIYHNGEKGSPIIALDKIKEHYLFNNLTCPNMTIWFNDLGESEIEDGISKISRVQRLEQSFGLPKNVKVEYFQENYATLCPKAVTVFNAAKRAKGLFFIDPYAYKIIKPDDIRSMLQSGNTEVLLWLPTNFMYRFAETALHSDFAGGEPLKEFITALFGQNQPQFKSRYDFIDQVKKQFQVYLGNMKIFVSTFTLESETKNVYGLFFFTSHIKGYETMLRAKWELDENRGKGHTINKTIPFSEIYLDNYPQKLLGYMSQSECRTNYEIYIFGLENEFLPKHTNEILKGWKKDGKIEVISLDGQPVRGNHLEYNSERRVGFKLRK
jgi:three-Cys-motif partner protein